MGSALYLAWKRLLVEWDVRAYDPAGGQDGVMPSLDALPPDYMPDYLVMAVKPQHMKEAAMLVQKKFPGYRGGVISIAAGTALAQLTEWFGAEAAIIRTMPNLPVLAGQGVTVLMANQRTSSAQECDVEVLFSSVGAVQWINTEPLFHAVTALSGSGPAYAALFLEILIRQGVAMGLSEAVAAALAVETFQGTLALAKMMVQQYPESNVLYHWETLRKNVTSPGGTTAAAVAVLQGETGLTPLKMLVESALKAAAQRSMELSGQ